MTGFETPDEVNEWLLSEEEDKCDEKRRQRTPLPKLQIAVLLFFQLAEPITSQCIYPFINQVRLLLVSSSPWNIVDIAIACGRA